ncbi:MAG: hypothetical protein KF894_28370 [Labilithrix sp.]|nr:hypothetical protein [Labilithrix sp.]
MHPAENMMALKHIGLALGLGLVACSGSSSPVPGSSEESNSVKVPPFSNDPRSPSAPSGEVPDKNVEGPGVAGKPDASTPEQPECAEEVEPNNDAATATEFTGCVIGKLSGRTDTDYLKITAPENVTDMIIDHVETPGTINYSVTIPAGGGGASGSSNFNMSFTDKAPRTKIKAGQTYLFALKWEGGSPGTTGANDARPYSVRVTFE